MGAGGPDATEFSYPSQPGYSPPVVLLGALLWTLAIVTVGGVWVAADLDAALGVTPATLVGTARAFVGVFVFAAVFPVAFRVRRRARET